MCRFGVIYVIFIVINGLLAEKLTIGIIGAGIGGSATAYYLRSLLNDSVGITIFESNEVGGRLSTRKIGSNRYEAGGSIAISRNLYISQLVDKLGLGRRANDLTDYTALYDGSRILFAESDWRAVTVSQVLWRYGFGPYYLNNHIGKMLNSFDNIYTLQDDMQGFENVTALLSAMEESFATDMLVSAIDGFKREGFSDAVIQELVASTLRVNYGQHLKVHKFVAAVSVSGAAGGLWAVEGGNDQVPRRLLEESGAELVQRPITRVERLPTGKIAVYPKSRSDIPPEGDDYLFDTVVIAAPQTDDMPHKINFKGFGPDVKFEGRYHRTVSTLLTGQLRVDQFPGAYPYTDAIFTTKPGSLFNSIGRVYPVDSEKPVNGSDVWKIFSQRPLTAEEIDSLFINPTEAQVVDWLAYPQYSTERRTDRFLLDDGLYHVNAIEWAASAMEMSLVGARNVAILLINTATMVWYKALRTRVPIVVREKLKEYFKMVWYILGTPWRDLRKFPADFRMISRRELFLTANQNSKILWKNAMVKRLTDLGLTRRNAQAQMSEFNRRLQKCSRAVPFFFNRHKQWLNGSIKVPHSTFSTVTRPGRPEKSFEELSGPSKRRKTAAATLRQETTPRLAFSAASRLHAKGQRTAGQLVRAISEDSSVATAFLEQKKLKPNKLSVEEGLLALIDADLNRRQYDIMRAVSPCLPSYKAVQAYKKFSYPEGVTVTEITADVPVKSLLEHTAKRILCMFEPLEPISDPLDDSSPNEMKLVLKWGVDGSTMPHFKQRWGDDRTPDLAAETHIVQSCLVPLQLENLITRDIKWQNPLPSSPRFCRPIRISCIKETSEVTTAEIARIEAEVADIGVLEIDSYKISFEMLKTMVDGKVINAATGIKSTQTCYICGATSKDFNNLPEIRNRPIKAGPLEYGMAVLHARIRIYEFLLMLGYNLPFQSARLRKEDAEARNARKREIQEGFRRKLGILVDVPKAGSGNTNDDNTSRKFFEFAEVSAEITGVDINLINKFKVILQVISCGKPIKTEEFEKYADSTAEFYVQNYPWKRMTPTVHKVLMHSRIIIENALLPIGQLSEEAAEARNKSLKAYRRGFSRKPSRTDCLTDVINRLLLTSDPYLSSISVYKTPRVRRYLMAEAAEFVIEEEEESEGEEEEEELEPESRASGSQEATHVSEWQEDSEEDEEEQLERESRASGSQESA